jgi:hypothetical protein
MGKLPAQESYPFAPVYFFATNGNHAVFSFLQGGKTSNPEEMSFMSRAFRYLACSLVCLAITVSGRSTERLDGRVEGCDEERGDGQNPSFVRAPFRKRWPQSDGLDL